MGRVIRKSLLQIALPALLALVAGSSAFVLAESSGTYYRWQDERGKLVVSDRPPQDEAITYEVVSPSTSLVRRVEPGEGAVPPEVVPRPGNEFDQVDTSEQSMQVVKKNPETCARAKSNLETLNTTARIRIRDADDGQLRYLTEDEKEAQRAKAREVMRTHCDEP